MSWNYRTVCDKDGFLGIREIYYDDDGEIDNMTVDDCSPGGENFKELVSDLMAMMAALDKPVINEKEFDVRSNS